jgi:hypothetical protein
VFELGKTVSGSDYNAKVLQPVVKLFVSPDRGTRMALLDMLPEYAEKLDAKTVTDKIWPHLVRSPRDTLGSLTLNTLAANRLYRHCRGDSGSDCPINRSRPCKGVIYLVAPIFRTCPLTDTVE